MIAARQEKREALAVRVVQSPVGELRLAASVRGLVECSFVDRLPTDGRSRAEPSPPRGDGGAESIVAAAAGQLAAYFAGTLREFAVPLDLRGTDFQRSVWERLLAIPFGSTCSYGDIARALGRPGASRAVGAANGQNAIAIIVPCHRVIDSAGGLHGYGGGLDRKRWLLEHETGPDLPLLVGNLTGPSRPASSPPPSPSPSPPGSSPPSPPPPAGP